MSAGYRNFSIVIEEMRLRHNENNRLLLAYSLGITLIFAAPILTVGIAAQHLGGRTDGSTQGRSMKTLSPRIASVIDEGWTKDNDVHYNESVRIWRK